ncbi:sulfate transporter [Desulfosarcina alkanivorans]|jgi:ABC-type transporter Mla MlaB component|uniref:Sulfate transporter n=1 Tax=Desulfosarcina alkanivorans TaxID=571177 RepID=A0A5K7YKP1_9BACT|nr:STAS domain-containing protein [Desulfosarcina alkanivorans]BBO68965.1 sulfate transporter [Desulfosarcina alkanivorans]
MHFKMAPSGDYGELTLTGELTIVQAKELRLALIHSLEQSDTVAINVDHVTDVDLSCLQLLCAVHRSALGSNKQITFNPSDSDVFRKVVQAAGYARHVGCVRSPDKNCFWTGELN